MCVGLRASFTEEFLEYFLSGPLRSLNLRLIDLYFRRVRVCRTVLEPDPGEVASSRADLCDCRLVERSCGNRLDLCFKLDRRAPAREPHPELREVSDAAHRGGLVRMRVETLGRKIEYCHCCTCCCQALRVERRLGPGHVLASGSLPETAGECRRCGECVTVCPIGAREVGGVDRDRCIGCGLCARACPGGAITMAPADGPLSWCAPASRERQLRRNQALAHLFAGLMTFYVLLLHRFYRAARAGA
jgi:ferredoxin